MSASPGSPYRLGELGWLQFERLCSLLLEAEAGLSDLRWRGRPDAGRIALVDDEIVLRDRGIRLPGPTAAAAFWVREGVGSGRRWLQLADMTDGWEAHECNDPEQVWRVFHPARRQVFVADDAFGSTVRRVYAHSSPGEAVARGGTGFRAPEELDEHRPLSSAGEPEDRPRRRR